MPCTCSHWPSGSPGPRRRAQPRRAAQPHPRLFWPAGAVSRSCNYRQSQRKAPNRSACCNFGFLIRIEGLAQAYPKEASYESEISSGCTFRMTHPSTLTWLLASRPPHPAHRARPVRGLRLSQPQSVRHHHHHRHSGDRALPIAGRSAGLVS